MQIVSKMDTKKGPSSPMEENIHCNEYTHKHA